METSAKEPSANLDKAQQLGITDLANLDTAGAAVFAEWLRRQGHHVHRTVNSYWYDAAPGVYEAFPYHWLIQPTSQELNEIFFKSRAIALRYFAPANNPHGCISYYLVYNQPSYIIDMLDRRSRQNVRTGLKNCTIEAIPMERLAEEGWLLETDTVARQGRRERVEKQTWKQRYMAAADMPGFEAWGALVEGRLVASMLSFGYENWYELISQQCHRDFMCARVNNALTFVVTQTLINRPQIKCIYYTHQSLDAPPSIDEFKLRMGYTPLPVRQQIVFNPVIAPMANRFSHMMVRQILRWKPGSRMFGKAEGMLRFYLKGRLPLNEQEPPECLKDQYPQSGASNTLDHPAEISDTNAPQLLGDPRR